MVMQLSASLPTEGLGKGYWKKYFIHFFPRRTDAVPLSVLRAHICSAKYSLKVAQIASCKNWNFLPSTNFKPT